MPSVLGNLIVISAVAALVFVCARYQWKLQKQGGCGGSCAQCGGSCGVYAKRGGCPGNCGGDGKAV